MPSGKHKSGTLRKISVKTPGGRTTTQFKKRKPSAAKCVACGAVLKGVPRELPSKMTNLPKSSKRPERPYGGNLCSACARATIKLKSRNS